MTRSASCSHLQGVLGKLTAGQGLLGQRRLRAGAEAHGPIQEQADCEDADQACTHAQLESRDRSHKSCIVRRRAPPAERQPAFSATASTFLRGPSLMKGPGRKKPCARPTSMPRRVGDTPIL